MPPLLPRRPEHISVKTVLDSSVTCAGEGQYLGTARQRRRARPWLPRTETPEAGRTYQQGTDGAGETLNSSPGVVVGALELLVRAVPRCPDILDGRSHGPPFGLDRGRPGEGAEAAQRLLPVDDVGRSVHLVL